MFGFEQKISPKASIYSMHIKYGKHMKLYRHILCDLTWKHLFFHYKTSFSILFSVFREMYLYEDIGLQKKKKIFDFQALQYHYVLNETVYLTILPINCDFQYSPYNGILKASGCKRWTRHLAGACIYLFMWQRGLVFTVHMDWSHQSILLWQTHLWSWASWTVCAI